MKTQNVEVVHSYYIGCDTPLLSINDYSFEELGTKTESGDNGNFVNKVEITKCDIIILKHSF